jgi:hypothetical protein
LMGLFNARPVEQPSVSPGVVESIGYPGSKLD